MVIMAYCFRGEQMSGGQWIAKDELTIKMIGHVTRRGAILRFKTYEVALFEFYTPGRFGPSFLDKWGRFWTAELNGEQSDLGSVPPDLTWLAGAATSYPCSYAFHDIGCRFNGLYMWDGMGFVFENLRRKDIDELLPQMVRAEGAGWGESQAIYAGVRLGSRFPKLRDHYA